MEISRLKVFINLVETRNYTRTAKALHMSQPMVTHDIKAIENEIGTKLFDRSNKYVHVTSDGEAFYNKIKPLINRYYLAVQEIQQTSDAEQNTITIGFSYTPFNSQEIPIWIRGFNQLYPDVKFNIETLNHNKLKHYLETNEIDILVTSKEDEADLSNIKSYPLMTDHFFALMQPDHPLANRKLLALKDFQNQRVIFVDNDWVGAESVKLQEKMIQVNDRLAITYTNDFSSAEILINANQGIGFGLNFIYPDSNERLIHVPIEWSQTVAFDAVIHKSNDKHCVHDFIKYVQNVIHDH